LVHPSDLRRLPVPPAKGRIKEHTHSAGGCASPGILLIGGEDWVACLEPHSSTQLAMRLRLVIPLVRPSRLPVVYFGAASV
jgi:hypothetical protein